MIDFYHHHEHKEVRAPTDDSIRLLKEMEEKVRASVVASISVLDNKFNAVVHVQKDILSCNTNFAVVFTLNGAKHDVRVETSDWDSAEEVIDKVVKEVAIYVAVSILRVPLSKVLHEIQRSKR